MYSNLGLTYYHLLNSSPLAKPLRDSPSLIPAPAVADSSTDTSSPHVTANLTSSGAARTSCPMQILTAFPRARLPLPCLFSRPFIFQIKQSLCGDSSSSHFSPPRRTLYQPLLCTIARRCFCVWCWRIFSVIFCPPRCLFCVFFILQQYFYFIECRPADAVSDWLPWPPPPPPHLRPGGRV